MGTETMGMLMAGLDVVLEREAVAHLRIWTWVLLI
jgi:hypothetical protein